MAVDVEQAQVAGAGRAELRATGRPSRTSPGRDAERDEGAPESAQFGARPGAQRTGNRDVGRALDERKTFAVIGPTRPSMVPRYMPFERSDTWRAANLGSGLGGQEQGQGNDKACHNGGRRGCESARNGYISRPGPGLLHFFTNRRRRASATQTTHPS